MEHVAIDLGGRESQICIRSPDGQVIEERRCATGSLGRFLAKRPKSRVVLETCAESFAIADDALMLGHEVRIVPATLVRSLGVGSRRTKTDRRDAQILSEVSCRIDLPTVHVPSSKARQRKTLVGMRAGLGAARTKLINSVRGYLRTLAKRLATRGAATFPRRVREFFEQNGAALPACVERELLVIEALTEQIRAADKEIADDAKQDPICWRLMTAPGVGPMTAVNFVATLDAIGRFGGAHQVESYLGLVPGENSSSDRQSRTGLTKAGSPRMRWLMIQAAWACLRSRQQGPLQQWTLEVKKRRGVRVAIAALARKLTGILYALWRDGTTFESSRGAQEVAAE